MLPENLRNNINLITNLINDFGYMKKNKDELIQLKKDIVWVIDNLDNCGRNCICDIVLKDNISLKIQKNYVTVEDYQNTSDFYENCGVVKVVFQNFYDKVKKRIALLNNEQIEYSNVQKDQFYYIVNNYIKNNKVQELEKLLSERIIDLNYIPSRATANPRYFHNVNLIHLMIKACYINNLMIIKLLYNNGANINVRGYLNQQYKWTTPLLIAIINFHNTKNSEIINFLLDHGALPLFCYSNHINDMPLTKALDYPDLFEKMIKKYNIDVNLNESYESDSDDDNSEDDDFQDYDNDKNTFLHYACQKIELRNVKILLEEDARVNVKNFEGDTPLHCLFKNISEKNFKQLIEVIDLFIDKDVNILNIQNDLGETALHIAADQTIDPNIIEYLLTKNVNTNILNTDGDTALDYLINKFNYWKIEIVKKIINLFINKNYKFNLKNHSGNTILHKMLKKSLNFDIIQYLIEKGADSNIKNNNNDSVLHILINFEDADEYSDKYGEKFINEVKKLMNLFINNKCDINNQNNQGETALHQAVQMEIDKEIINYLLKFGAKIDIKNKDNKSPLDLAKECKNKEILNLINSFISNIEGPSTVKIGKKRKFEDDEND